MAEASAADATSERRLTHRRVTSETGPALDFLSALIYGATMPDFPRATVQPMHMPFLYAGTKQLKYAHFRFPIPFTTKAVHMMWDIVTPRFRVSLGNRRDKFGI